MSQGAAHSSNVGSSSRATSPPDWTYLRRDPEFYSQLRAKPDIVNYLSSRGTSSIQDLPPYLCNAIMDIPRAWTTDLDVLCKSDNFQEMQDQSLVYAHRSIVLQHRSIELSRKKFQEIHTLQESVSNLEMEKERLIEEISSLKISVANGFTQLTAALKEKEEALQGKTRATLECQRLRNEYSGEREKWESRAAQYQADAERMAVEHAQNVERIAELTRSLTVSRQETELVRKEYSKFKSVADLMEEAAMEYSYYEAYAEAIRSVCRAGEGQGFNALVQNFKRYVMTNPPRPHVKYELLDLSVHYNVDLGWWPGPKGSLVLPSSFRAPRSPSGSGGL